MTETEYLLGNGLLVTSSRIDINGQTFAVRNVGSVQVRAPGRPLGAALVGLIGVVMLVAASGGPESYTPGAALLGGAAAWAWQKLRRRELVLVTGGGEVTALSSNDARSVEDLRAAIAAAISAR